MECYNSNSCAAKNFQGSCFSQGFVEFDSCKASCLYSTFDFKFDCTGMSQDECRLRCLIDDCESHCRKPEKSQLVCAKHGIVYPSECAMRCRNPNAVVRFKSSFHMADEFNYKCVQAYKADQGIGGDCCSKAPEVAVMVGSSGI